MPTDESRKAAKEWADKAHKPGTWIESLASLLDHVREQEREACAKVCDAEMQYNHPLESAAYCASLIRARSNDGV